VIAALCACAVAGLTACGDAAAPQRPPDATVSSPTTSSHGIALRASRSAKRVTVTVRSPRSAHGWLTVSDRAQSFRQRRPVRVRGGTTARVSVPVARGASACGDSVTAKVQLAGLRRPLVTSVRAPRTRAAGAARLRWQPPALTEPEYVRVSESRRSLQLDPQRDYVVEMPSKPVTGAGGVVIAGGHNVKLVGGEIDVSSGGRGPVSRGLFLKGQTGVVHVEGLLIRGSDLGEGIDLDQRLGATVQLQNIRVEYTHARDERTFRDTHPDLIQSWAGPRELRVDGFTGCTGYQGFFLHPTQFGSRMERAELSRINITGTRRSGYLLWQATPFPVVLRDVWMRPNPAKGANVLWPNSRAWPGTRIGTPRRGDFVPAGAAGTGYRAAG
jgi:hypothetical protein